MIDQGYRGAPRDTTGPQWTRRTRIARSTTDAQGRYRFTTVPRYEVVSVLVQGSMWQHYEVLGRYQAMHLESTFWLAHPPERQENLSVWDRWR